MKEKHLKIFAAVFVGLLILYFVTKPRHTSVNIDELVQTMVIGVAKEDVNTIEVYKETAAEEPSKLVFTRTGEEWRIPTHFRAKAQEYRVNRLLDDLLDMTGKVRSSDPGHFTNYRIEDVQGIHILLKDEADKTLANLIVGKKTEDANSGFVRFAGQDKVYFVDKNLLSDLSVYGSIDTLTTFNAAAFVDLQAVNEKKEDLQMVGLVENGREMVIKKVQKEVEEAQGDTATVRKTVSEWVLVRSGKEIALDQDEAGKFLDAATKIRASALVDGIQNTYQDMNKNTLYGFRRPSHYLVFRTGSDSPQMNVIFGKEYEKDKGYYMLVQYDGLVYEVSKSNFDNLFKWMKDLPSTTKS